MEDRTESSLRRIRMIVEYDGTNYAGWQRQSNALAVQQVVEEALTRLTGVPVTINSDNMAVSATDVRHELQIVADTFALTDGDIKLLLLNAANAAFASDALKAEMCRRIEAEF